MGHAAAAPSPARRLGVKRGQGRGGCGARAPAAHLAPTTRLPVALARCALYAGRRRSPTAHQQRLGEQHPQDHGKHHDHVRKRHIQKESGAGPQGANKAALKGLLRLAPRGGGCGRLLSLLALRPAVAAGRRPCCAPLAHRHGTRPEAAGAAAPTRWSGRKAPRVVEGEHCDDVCSKRVSIGSFVVSHLKRTVVFCCRLAMLGCAELVGPSLPPCFNATSS
jgi:hypothetical protein